MIRPVDANALLSKKRKVCNMYYVAAIDIIRAPTIKPDRPERQAAWMTAPDGSGYMCNACGEHVGLKRSNYCPECGAIMRGR